MEILNERGQKGSAIPLVSLRKINFKADLNDVLT